MSYITVALPSTYKMQVQSTNRDRSQLMEWMVENDSFFVDELLYISQMKKALQQGDFTTSSSL